MEKIPKIIHSLWFGPGDPPEIVGVPWEETMLDYQFKFWGNEEIKPYISELELLCGETPRITLTNASDAFRFMILRDFGGVYLDMDVEVLKDFSYILEGKTFVSGFQYGKCEHPLSYKTGATVKDIIINDFVECVDGEINAEQHIVNGIFVNASDYVNAHFIAATPNHNVILDAIINWVQNYMLPPEQKYPLSDLGHGPDDLTKALVKQGMVLNGETQDLGNGIIVYESDVLHPVHGGTKFQTGTKEYIDQLSSAYANESTYIIHHHHFHHNGAIVASINSSQEVQEKHFWMYKHWIENTL